MIEWFATSFILVLLFIRMISRLGVSSVPVVARVGNVAHAAFGAFVASLSFNGFIVEVLVTLFMYFIYMAARFVGFGVGIERGLISFIGGYVFALVSTL